MEPTNVQAVRDDGAFARRHIDTVVGRLREDQSSPSFEPDECEDSARTETKMPSPRDVVGHQVP
jgi:hypothetical protein